jgi:hypothetical protein
MVLQLAQTKADELNKQLKLTGDKEITRQELLRLFTAGGRNVSATDEQPPEADAPKPAKKKAGAA